MLKRVTALTIALVILIAGMTACGLPFETSKTENHSVEESKTESSAVSNPTQEPSNKPTPSPDPTPTPEPQFISSYDQLTEESRSSLESTAEDAIESYFESYDSDTIESTQFRTVAGTGRPSPKKEDYLYFDGELDSVYVLSGANDASLPNNRVVFLYSGAANFKEDTHEGAKAPESLDYYIAVSVDNVGLVADGFGQDYGEAYVDQVVDPQFYDFYDLYEEAVASKNDQYSSIKETIMSDKHVERIESREKEEQWLIDNQLRLDMWVSLFNNRHMIEADIRGMDATQLNDRLVEYKAYAERQSSDEWWTEMFPKAKENFDYNIAFLEDHLAKLSQEPKLTPEPENQDTSAFTGLWSVDPTKTNEMNSDSLMFRFGSMLKTSSMEMTVGESGYFDFGLGAEGGEGSYIIEDGEIIATYCAYNGGKEITVHIPMVEEDGTEYLVMTFPSDNYQVYWKK